MSDTDIRPPGSEPGPGDPHGPYGGGDDPAAEAGGPSEPGGGYDGYGSYGSWASQWRDDEKVSGSRRWIGIVVILALLVALGVFGSWAMVVIVLALVVSIALHEAGHFLTARWAGMKATEYFIGFGPRLWSFRRGETEYGIKAIPAGAYVRIIGMHNLEEVDPADEDRTYRSKPYPKRLAVILAGPMANILLGFLVLVGVFAISGRIDPNNWTVQKVSGNSVAAQIGIREGDQVTAIDGQPVGQFKDLRDLLDRKAGAPATVTVLRDGQTIQIAAPSMGWRLNDKGAAALPGMLARDLVLNDDETLYSGTYQDFAKTLREGTGPYTYKFQRGGWVFSNTVNRPLEIPADGASGFFGIAPRTSPAQRDSLPQAVVHAGTTVGGVVVDSGKALGRLFSPTGIQNYANTVVENAGGGQPSVSQLHALDGVESKAPSGDLNRPVSIVGVVRLGGDTAQYSIPAAIFLFAIINISLGLLNLLPLLPLDGGHAAVATYEAIRSRRGRPYRVNMAKLMPLTYGVVALMLVFGLTSIFLDIRAPISP